MHALFVLLFTAYTSASLHPLPNPFRVCDVVLPWSLNQSETIKTMISLNLGTTFYWSDLSVVSFNDIMANSGHIGGRVAARNDISVSGGFLIGDQAIEDLHHPSRYSFIAGGNARWNSGTLLPANEYAFVGHNFTGPDYLAARIVGNAHSGGSVQPYFDAARLYLILLSHLFMDLPQNVHVYQKWTTIFIECLGSNLDHQYVAQVPSHFFAISNVYSVSDTCNRNYSFVINVFDGDLLFQGGAFPWASERTLYNIAGHRNVIVSTGVNGNILAPLSRYLQTNGETTGKLLMGDISLIQTAFAPRCTMDTAWPDQDQEMRLAKSDSSKMETRWFIVIALAIFARV